MTFDLKEAGPVRIGDIDEGLGLEDAGIVDEDVDVGSGPHEPVASGGRRYVGGDPAEIRAGNLGS